MKWVVPFFEVAKHNTQLKVTGKSRRGNAKGFMTVSLRLAMAMLG
jgi:hypothetical protein